MVDTTVTATGMGSSLGILGIAASLTGRQLRIEGGEAAVDSTNAQLAYSLIEGGFGSARNYSCIGNYDASFTPVVCP